MHEIEKWLKSKQDWNQGLAIFGKYSPNSNLLRTYTRAGPTPARKKDLAYEMGKLLKQTAAVRPVKKKPKPKPAQVKSKPAKKATAPVVDVLPEVTPAMSIQETTGKDPQLDDLIEKKNDLFKRYVAMLHQIEHLGQEERRKMALQMLETFDEVNRLWMKIDYCQQFGVIPADPPDKRKKKQVSQMEIEELIRRKHTVRTYVSRYNRRLQKSKDPKKRAFNEEKLNEYSLELEEIEKKLMQIN